MKIYRSNKNHPKNFKFIISDGLNIQGSNDISSSSKRIKKKDFEYYLSRGFYTEIASGENIQSIIRSNPNVFSE